MSSKANEDLARLTELSRRYRIVFTADPSQVQVHKCHEKSIEAVFELGSKRFASYASIPEIAESDPWKATAKSLAQMLVEKAERCRQRNESCWRFACEPLVFARLSGDVVCRNCRKRVWRSEIEVCRTSGNSTSAENLAKRQNAREPCRCPRVARSHDLNEAVGLNRMFCHREDEEVHFEKDLAKQLRKELQKPDAIYGLRRTRNIENLLYDSRKRMLDEDDDPRQLHELLEPSPSDNAISPTGDPLLYPFLVIEAKSGQAQKDWHSINMQTAFPIRAFLQIQARLQHTADPRGSFGPLVWFFSYKGEDWRLSMAFMQETTTEENRIGDVIYKVVDVWRGSILTLDGSLQLLLLVDYIFDWARDNYRPNIIRLLRGLANGENDAASMSYADTDIYSTRRENTVPILNEEYERQTFMDRLSMKKQFAQLDTDDCAIRHAALSETRYRCLYLTEDTYDLFLRSTTASPEHAAKLRNSLCRQIIDPVLVHAKTLENLEQTWTGNCRLSGSRDSLFYVSLSFSTFLSATWDVIREIHVIAFAQSLIGKFYPNCGTLATETEDNMMLDIVQSLRDVSMATQLAAAISRHCFVIHDQFHAAFSPSEMSAVSDIVGTQLKDTDVSVAAADKGDRGGQACEHCEREFYGVPHSCGPHSISRFYLRDAIEYIYRACKKGSTEPEEPFLRRSERLDQVQHTGLDTGSPTSAEADTIEASEDGYVLIWSYKTIRATEKSKANICVYVITEKMAAPERPELMEKARRAFETVDVYHTARQIDKRNFTAAILSPGGSVWNLSNTYGVYSLGYEFYAFFFRECHMPEYPVMQGSARTRHETGRYVWQRNLSPGSEATLQGVKHSVFIQFQVLVQELSFWSAKAVAKSEAGIDCCRLCGVEDPAREPGGDQPNLCSTCYYIRFPKRRGKWDPDFSVRSLVWAHLLRQLKASRSCSEHYSHLRDPAMLVHGDPDNADVKGGLSLLETCAEFRRPFRDLRALISEWFLFQAFVKDGRRSKVPARVPFPMRRDDSGKLRLRREQWQEVAEETEDRGSKAQKRKRRNGRESSGRRLKEAKSHTGEE